MDWLGDFMHKFANDAADERKREAEERKMLLEQANYRESQAFEKITSRDSKPLSLCRTYCVNRMIWLCTAKTRFVLT